MKPQIRVLMNIDPEVWGGEGGAGRAPLGVRATSMNHTMKDGIAAGSILIAEGTHLPDSLRLQSEPHSSGWLAVKIAHSAFEKEVQAAGWTFFFMAGEIKSTVFAFDPQKRLREALERLLTSVKSQNCNSIEITQVTDKSFLKVPYVTVSAHARHLQKGLLLFGQR